MRLNLFPFSQRAVGLFVDGELRCRSRYTLKKIREAVVGNVLVHVAISLLGSQDRIGASPWLRASCFGEYFLTFD